MSSYGGVQMVQLYKNQFQWIKGSDKLRKVLLRDCSPLEEFMPPVVVLQLVLVLLK